MTSSSHNSRARITAQSRSRSLRRLVRLVAGVEQRGDDGQSTQPGQHQHGRRGAPGSAERGLDAFDRADVFLAQQAADFILESSCCSLPGQNRSRKDRHFRQQADQHQQNQPLPQILAADLRALQADLLAGADLAVIGVAHAVFQRDRIDASPVPTRGPDR